MDKICPGCEQPILDGEPRDTRGAMFGECWHFECGQRAGSQGPGRQLTVLIARPVEAPPKKMRAYARREEGKPGRLARKIAERLIEDGYALNCSPEQAVISRIRPGAHQRSEGAWSWYLAYLNGDVLYPAVAGDVGSQYPASQIAQAKRLSYYQSPGGLTLSPLAD